MEEEPQKEIQDMVKASTFSTLSTQQDGKGVASVAPVGALAALEVSSPFRLIPTAHHDAYIESIRVEKYEKSLQNQLKSVWKDLGSIFSDVTAPGNPAQDRQRYQRKVDSQFLVKILNYLLDAPNKHHGVTVKTITRIREAAETEEARQALGIHLYDRICKKIPDPDLPDYSFFPIKEILIEILVVSIEKKDFRTAFYVMLSTQGFKLKQEEYDTGSDSPSKLRNRPSKNKLMSEYYYTQPAIRSQVLWSSIINIYHQMFVFHQFKAEKGKDSSLAYQFSLILKANLFNMLYCLRSKDTFLQICKQCLQESNNKNSEGGQKSQDWQKYYEQLSKEVENIEKITKEQSKLSIINHVKL